MTVVWKSNMLYAKLFVYTSSVTQSDELWHWTLKHYQYQMTTQLNSLKCLQFGHKNWKNDAWNPQIMIGDIRTIQAVERLSVKRGGRRTHRDKDNTEWQTDSQLSTHCYHCKSMYMMWRQTGNTKLTQRKQAQSARYQCCDRQTDRRTLWTTIAPLH